MQNGDDERQETDRPDHTAVFIKMNNDGDDNHLATDGETAGDIDSDDETDAELLARARRGIEADVLEVLRAVETGALEDVRTMITRDPVLVLRAADTEGRSSFYIACMMDRPAVASLLLDVRGVDVNRANVRGVTPLFAASQDGRAAIVRLLIDAPGVDVNLVNSEGDTPLNVASYFGHAACVERLLRAPGIDANASGPNAPLHAAAQQGHAAIVAALLGASGVDVNRLDVDRATPLLVAAEQGHAAIVASLLAAPGVAVNLGDGDGTTPLLVAAENGHAATVALLLAAPGVDVNRATTESGTTPLGAACSGGHAAVVARLLGAPGIELDNHAAAHRRPLLLAATGGHDAVVRLLVWRGASLAGEFANDVVARARLEGHVATAAFLRAVRAAGGVEQYRAEPLRQVEREGARARRLGVCGGKRDLDRATAKGSSAAREQLVS